MNKTLKILRNPVPVEFILPDKVELFLKENGLRYTDLFTNPKWEACIAEDLEDEDEEEPIEYNVNRAKIVINQIQLAHDHGISVAPEHYAKGKFIGGGTWAKERFFKDFAVSYSIFAE